MYIAIVPCDSRQCHMIEMTRRPASFQEIWSKVPFAVGVTDSPNFATVNGTTAMGAGNQDWEGMWIQKGM